MARITVRQTSRRIKNLGWHQKQITKTVFGKKNCGNFCARATAWLRARREILFASFRICSLCAQKFIVANLCKSLRNAWAQFATPGEASIRLKAGKKESKTEIKLQQTEFLNYVFSAQFFMRQRVGKTCGDEGTGALGSSKVWLETSFVAWTLKFRVFHSGKFPKGAKFRNFPLSHSPPTFLFLALTKVKRHNSLKYEKMSFTFYTLSWEAKSNWASICSACMFGETMFKNVQQKTILKLLEIVSELLFIYAT